MRRALDRAKRPLSGKNMREHENDDLEPLFLDFQVYDQGPMGDVRPELAKWQNENKSDPSRCRSFSRGAAADGSACGVW